MATLLEIYNARFEPSLISRAQAAVLNASNDISNEAPETPNHAERLASALACLSAKAGYLNLFTNAIMFPISTNPVIAANPIGATDNDIQFVVNYNYTNIALANPPV